MRGGGRAWLGDTLFLVAGALWGLYMGGERRDAPRPEHQWKVLCLDLASGKVRWEKVVHHGQPAGPKHVKNTYASETPVTDGERVYACIGNVGIFCLDFDGRQVWSKALEPHKRMVML